MRLTSAVFSALVLWFAAPATVLGFEPAPEQPVELLEGEDIITGGTDSPPVNPNGTASTSASSTTPASSTSSTEPPEMDEVAGLPKNCIFRQRVYGDVGFIVPKPTMTACDQVKVKMIWCSSGRCKTHFETEKLKNENTKSASIQVKTFIFNASACQQACANYNGWEDCHEFVFVEDGSFKNSCFLMMDMKPCDKQYACIPESENATLKIVSGPKRCDPYQGSMAATIRNTSSYCVKPTPAPEGEKQGSWTADIINRVVETTTDPWTVVITLYVLSACCFCIRLCTLQLPELPERQSGSSDGLDLSHLRTELQTLCDTGSQEAHRALQDPVGTGVTTTAVLLSGDAYTSYGGQVSTDKPAKPKKKKKAAASSTAASSSSDPAATGTGSSSLQPMSSSLSTGGSKRSQSKSQSPSQADVEEKRQADLEDDRRQGRARRRIIEDDPDVQERLEAGQRSGSKASRADSEEAPPPPVKKKSRRKPLPEQPSPYPDAVTRTGSSSQSSSSRLPEGTSTIVHTQRNNNNNQDSDDEDEGCCPDSEACNWCMTCGTSGTNGAWKWFRTCGWCGVFLIIFILWPKDAWKPDG